MPSRPRSEARSLALLLAAAVLGCGGLVALWLLGGPAPRDDAPPPVPPGLPGGEHLAGVPLETERVVEGLAEPGAPAARSEFGSLVPAAELPPAQRSRPPTRLRLRVLSSDGEPLRGADAEFRLRRPGGDDQPLVRLRTDAEGVCVAELRQLEDLHPFEVARHSVVVRASHEGYRSQEIRTRADQLYASVLELRVTLPRGAAVRGRVLDPLGDPVAGARVSVLGASADGQGPQEVLARTTSHGDGAFTAGLEPAASPVLLVASSSSHGRAVRELGVVADASIEVGDLVLQALGEISGRVVFPDGRPARRTLVQAQPVDSSRFARGAPDDLAQHGGRTETDEAGRFRFALLEPGVYRLDAGNPYSLDREPAARATRTFATPARDVLLQAEHVALCIRVVDRSGRALAGVGLDARRVRAEVELRRGRAVETLELVDRQWSGTRGDPPEAILAVDPGDRVVLRTELDSCHPLQQLVLANAAPGEQELVLEVFSRAEFALVRPRVVGPGGETTSSFCVDVFDPFTRLLVREGLEPDGDGLLPALAPGTWLLHARPLGAAARSSGPLPGGLGVQVALRAGGPQALELRLE